MSSATEPRRSDVAAGRGRGGARLGLGEGGYTLVKALKD